MAVRRRRDARASACCRSPSMRSMDAQSSTDSQRLAVARDGRRRGGSCRPSESTARACRPSRSATSARWTSSGGHPTIGSSSLRAQRPDGSVDLFLIRPGRVGRPPAGPPAARAASRPRRGLLRCRMEPVRHAASGTTRSSPTRRPGNGQFRDPSRQSRWLGRHPAPRRRPAGVNQAWAQSSPDGKTILVQRFRLRRPGEVWLALSAGRRSGPAREIGRHHFRRTARASTWAGRPTGARSSCWTTPRRLRLDRPGHRRRDEDRLAARRAFRTGDGIRAVSSTSA